MINITPRALYEVTFFCNIIFSKFFFCKKICEKKEEEEEEKMGKAKTKIMLTFFNNCFYVQVNTLLMSIQYSPRVDINSYFNYKKS